MEGKNLWFPSTWSSLSFVVGYCRVHVSQVSSLGASWHILMGLNVRELKMRRMMWIADEIWIRSRIWISDVTYFLLHTLILMSDLLQIPEILILDYWVGFMFFLRHAVSEMRNRLTSEVAEWAWSFSEKKRLFELQKACWKKNNCTARG